MSDIRVNRWLHQSGTGGVYQDSTGRVGIGTSVPTSALDVQSGTIKIGSNTLSSSGVSTFSSGIVISAGTTAAPSISPTGDSNTGIFFPSADTIAFAEGGVEAARFDSSGRLGIGTISAVKPLDVRGEATFGVGITTGDLNWSKDDNQLVYTFSGTASGANPADGTVALVNPNSNPSASRVGTIVFGNKVSGTSVTGNPGIKAFIESYTNTNVANAADTGGLLRFYTKPDNGELGVQMQLNSNGNLLFNSGYGSAATAYGVRAWVRFNGSGSNSTNQTISGSGNVSTVFKNGTGDYTVNFTNAFVDANYAVTHAAGIQNVNWGIHLRHNSVAPTTSAYRFKNVTPVDSDTDAPFANLAFYR
jgi:hypothetical protein